MTRARSADEFVRGAMCLLATSIFVGCNLLSGVGDLSAGGSSISGARPCEGDLAVCSGECVDPRSNPKNCGACGQACGSALVCSAGECKDTCAAGLTACDGACVDVRTSAANCGTCGNACGAKEECDGAKCVVACKYNLDQPVADAWGTSWDGRERGAATFAEAKLTCESLRARLPTPSEAHRVSTVRSGAVGRDIDTNPLWTLAPYSPTAHTTLQLSDGATAFTEDTESLHYRCACPVPAPATFTGQNCNGPPDGACYGLASEGKRYNMDLEDRASVSKGTAIWECMFHRGRLATPLQYAEAILQGIGAGSGDYLHAADDARYDLTSTIRWTDPAMFGTDPSVSWSEMQAVHPFRCVGINYEAGTHPVAVANEFVGPKTAYKSETVDNAAAEWAASHDVCFSRGGHLPTSAELAALVNDGLPGGTGTFLWTSDQTGFSNPQFLAATKAWSGTPSAFSYVSPTDSGWTFKTSAGIPFRCIYYAVDAPSPGPAAENCSGGCSKIALPGASGAAMWFDASDRPAAPLLAAVDSCRRSGGRLPSERDLTEAIRHGLGNGSGVDILTSDLSHTTYNTIWTGTVKWTGTDPAFTDQYSTYSTRTSLETAAPYRCTWTNELR